MAHKRASYQYQPLTRGWYIRVLTIEPLNPNEPSTLLKVNLVERHLRSAIFDALSYVWGNQDQRCCISCNGYEHWIGQNLHEALVEYRRRGAVRDVWADAICINQQCETEKTQQVRMMSQIYEAARRTITWLGQFQPGDAEAIKLAELIYARCWNDGYDHQRDGLSSTDLDLEARGIPVVMDRHLGINSSWQALFNLLSHSWFNRVWVVQELLVSPNPKMWRGDRSVSTEIVLLAALLVGEKRNLREHFGTIQSSQSFPAQAVAICRHRYRTIDDHPIWVTMDHTTSLEATDMRDRYFALAGICTGDLSDFVDYTRTIEPIACQVGMMALLGTPEFQMMDGLDHLADHPSLHLRSQQIIHPFMGPKSHLTASVRV